MKTHDQIMAESARARETAKKESAIWVAGTSATAEEMEAAYEDYVVKELETGNNNYADFETWAQAWYGIPNK